MTQEKIGICLKCGALLHKDHTDQSCERILATTHKMTSAERGCNGRKGYRVTCACGETWLRWDGNLDRVIEQTYELHLRRLASN